MANRRKSGINLLQLLTIFSILGQLKADLSPPNNAGLGVVDEINVGVILDIGSWVGKTIHSCISMAMSDFYAINHLYRTRIVLHTRDTEGKPFRALSSALDLLENRKVQAIIGPETFLEEKYLTFLVDEARVPIFSFAPSSISYTQYPYVVKVVQDQASQFEGIATLVKSYKWKNVILIYEDTDIDRETLSFIVESFQAKKIHIVHRSAISPSFTYDEIQKELNNLMKVQTTVYIVHMSAFLASRIFLSANRLGMMEDGYAWIITDKIMNFFHSMEPEIVELLQGAIGFQPYIPPSSKLTNVASRWRRLHYTNSSIRELRNLSVFGIWAYDTIWALAEAVERVANETMNARDLLTRLTSVNLAKLEDSYIGKILVNEISQVRFKGLAGDFQIKEGKLNSNAFIIVNIVSKYVRQVGFWNPIDGITGKINPSLRDMHPDPKSGLEAISWPGGSEITPKDHQLMKISSVKLRIGIPMLKGFEELINVRHDSQTNATNVTGFCIDVFQAAIRDLPYEVTYDFVILENGRYNDYVYQVYLGNIDALVGDVTITANRSLYVDFSAPFTDFGVGTVTLLDDKDMWIFLKILDAKLWIATGGFVILTSAAVWAIESHYKNVEFKGSLSQQIGTALFYGFSSIVFAHRERLESNLSRIVVAVWLFLVLILTSTYTATLSSLFTVEQIHLTSAGEYIGTHGGSIVRGLITNNMNFEDDRLRPYYSLEEYADALSKGFKNGGVTAIVDEIPYIKIFLARYSAIDGYVMIASASTTNGFGFVFQKGSYLVPNISKAIINLREEGKLSMMEKEWFKSQSSLLPNDAMSHPKILTFDRFRGLFLISGICTASALVVIGFRMLLQRFQLNHFLVRLLNGGNLALMIRNLVPIRNEIELTKT